MTAALPDRPVETPASGAAAADSGEGLRDEVRPHRFGGAPVRTGIRLSGLERLGDRLARRARTAIEPMARCKTQVTALPLMTERFEGYAAGLPAFAALNLYRMRPLKGSMMIVLEPGFVTTLVDSFYGGTGTSAATGSQQRATEFTAAEERLAARLADQIGVLAGECWAEVTPLQLQVSARETNPAYAAMVRADEMVIVQRLEVAPTGQKAAHIDIVYPLASLRPVEALLASRVADEASPADSVWRERLGDALATVRLPVRSVLARPELTVGQLLALKPGDIVPISLAQYVPLAVAGKPIAKGTIGEREGRAAMIVEQIGGRD